MKVKEVICEALRLVGRDDVADAISAGQTLTDEKSRIKRAFLTYLNSVLDELARGYFPLDAQEDMSSSNGRFAFADFNYGPIKIRRVKSGGKDVKWSVIPDYLLADADSITVYYEYAPPTLAENDDFDYPAYAVGKNLVEYGMVAEHYLVLGAASESGAWEEKYRDEIEALLARCSLRDRIPPRRWI